MPKKFVFDGVSSLDMHLVIQHPPVYSAPSKKIDFVDVEGSRDFSNYPPMTGFGSYDVTYDVAFIPSGPESYYAEMRAIALWLLGLSGKDNGSRVYKSVLTDDYEPDVYRLATYSGPPDISNFLRQAGKGTITFTVGPRRHFFSGNIAESLTLGTAKTFVNNFMPVGPKIEITGTAPVDVRWFTGTSSNPTDQVRISFAARSSGETPMIYDCERMLAYIPSQNKVVNRVVTYTDHRAIQFVNGENKVLASTPSSSSTSVSSIKIYPCWWTL